MSKQIRQSIEFVFLVGPIALFWFIPWYWVIGYYNIYFTYMSFLMYKTMESEKKYSLLYFIFIPLILGFLGWLIVIFTGSKEDRKDVPDDFKTSKSNSLEDNELTEEEIEETNLDIPDITKDEIDESDESDDTAIKDIESYLGGDDNPNKNLFLWAYDFNRGKKGTNIPAEKINKMIEEELLSVEKLPDTARSAIEIGRNFAYITYLGFIRIDIGYMAGILSKTEDDKFYRWEDLEQYHAIYTRVSDYINKTYGFK